MHLRKVTRDVLLMRLERPTADFEQLGVAPEALNVVFCHVPVAAHDLHGGGGDLLGRRRSVGLHAVRIEALTGLAKHQVRG